MKIKELKLKNFATFENFELVFNDGITHLIGVNGSGKTTIGLTAIWAGFKGIAEKSGTGHLIGERYRFISEGKKSLDIEIVLHDENTDNTITLKRHITKSLNTITITPNTDKQLTKEYIENLFNVAFLSASHFTALTGEQQAAAMGIDTSSYDDKLQEEKEAAQGFRRDIKKIGDLEPVEKVEKKDIDVLYEMQRKARTHNEVQANIIKTWDECTEEIIDIDEELKELEAQAEALNERRITASITKKELPPKAKPIDLAPLEDEIKSIVESNQEYYKYETYRKELAVREELSGYLQENLERQADIADVRADYLQSKTFGIKGLQIDGKGRLTKDDKLIRSPYFSKGELEVLVARIGMNLNPELKVRFIDDFELLDDSNQKLLIKNLTNRGFQIITAQVGDKVKGDNSVLLRSCHVEDDPRQGNFKKTRKVPEQDKTVAEIPCDQDEDGNITHDEDDYC